MKLHELLKNIKPLQVAGDSEAEITRVNIDSRRIAKGHLFVAMRGTQVDGHKFIGKAIDRPKMRWAAWPPSSTESRPRNSNWWA